MLRFSVPVWLIQNTFNLEWSMAVSCRSLWHPFRPAGNNFTKANEAKLHLLVLLKGCEDLTYRCVSSMRSLWWPPHHFRYNLRKCWLKLLFDITVSSEFILLVPEKQLLLWRAFQNWTSKISLNMHVRIFRECKTINPALCKPFNYILKASNL